MTNEQRSRAEVAAFLADVPDRYFAYQSSGARGRLAFGDRITTWMGDPLARVIGIGRVWTSNVGDRRQHFTARTFDGVDYHGTAYLSAGDYVRMRRAAR